MHKNPEHSPQSNIDPAAASKNRYSDIINLERPLSKTHPPMSINNRAAQFSPYATLSGHQDIIATDEFNANNSPDHEIIYLDEESN